MKHIWIDADATPNKVKTILFKASERTDSALVFVANRHIQTPKRHNIRVHVVTAGFDKADDYIVENCTSGELVITADIPLAARCIEKASLVITPRGKELNRENIGPIHSARNLNEELRNSGMITGGPSAFTKRDVQNFANGLDRWIQINRARKE